MACNDRSPGGVRTGLLEMSAVAADTQVNTAQPTYLQARRLAERFRFSPALAAVIAGHAYAVPENWGGHAR